MKRKIKAVLLAAFLAMAFICQSIEATSSDDQGNQIKHPLSEGVQNIVNRAYQMTNIQWTPQANIAGWANEVTYYSGTTYTGLPYGQPVDANYVPWTTDLSGFVRAVNDSSSKMYTSCATYGERAPYYSCDCSAFVSWAWDLPSRQTTVSISNFAMKVSDVTYENAEVGDCICKAGVHVVLITDITYDQNGAINGIEISEATVNRATNYCCQRTWYGAGYSASLQDLQNKYFDNGYTLYRCKTRDNVTYSHNCNVPLDGDTCALCGVGSYLSVPVSASVCAVDDVTLYEMPDNSSQQLGTVYSGNDIHIVAFMQADDGTLWYCAKDSGWFCAAQTEFNFYLNSVSIANGAFPNGQLEHGVVFPIEGRISSINPIVKIEAAIYSGTDVSESPVQSKSVSFEKTYSYSLKNSALDAAMVFNALAEGSYTFVLKITERAYCPEGTQEMLLNTTETSQFSVGAGNAVITARGIDVSHHQGVIDWETVAPQIDFAIIRCGFGDDLPDQDDAQWRANADACTRLGIPFGVYIYSYALSDEQALSEAQHVLRLIADYQPSLPVYLDLEDSSIASKCTDADILRHAQIFCQAIETAGYTPGIYANYDWWTNRLTDATYDQWERWIARYASATGYSKNYSMWQYTSSGNVSGISGDVDMNYWYGAFPNVPCKHDYESVIVSDATCTEAGTVRYTCTLCGDQYTEMMAPLGHDYSSWKVAQEATCTTAGVEQSVCNRCGECVERTLPVSTVHKWILTEATEATCTEAGKRCYMCADCGIEKEQNVSAIGHDDQGAIVLPTCTEAGYTKHTCVRCGYVYCDNPVAAQGHQYEDGMCIRCGDMDPSLVLGDLNGDGDVTTADAVILARYLVELESLTPVQRIVADIDQDGVITSADAVILAKYLSETIRALETVHT